MDKVAEQEQPVRDERGRFVNSPGPGRPRRPIEVAYMRELMDVVGLTAWRAIIERARDDALAGDKSAREFIARHLLGTNPPAPMDVAVRDELDIPEHAEVVAQAKSQTTSGLLANWDLSTDLERARDVVRGWRAEQERQALADERRRRKLERERAAAGQEPAGQQTPNS